MTARLIIGLESHSRVHPERLYVHRILAPGSYISQSEAEVPHEVGVQVVDDVVDLFACQQDIEYEIIWGGSESRVRKQGRGKLLTESIKSTITHGLGTAHGRSSLLVAHGFS